MWIQTRYDTERFVQFFRLIFGYDTLGNYMATNFHIVQNFNYSLTELELMLPWERDTNIILMEQYIEERKKAGGGNEYA